MLYYKQLKLIIMSVKNIVGFLKNKPSYLKWGSKRLSNKFSVSEKTMSKIKTSLIDTKISYLASL